MSTTIRKALPHEASLLINIYAREGLLNSEKTVEEHVYFDFARIGIDRIIWFVEEEGNAIGSLQMVLDLPQKDLANGIDRAYFHHFRIAKEFQNKGYGSKIYKHVEEEARKMGIKVLTQEVEKTNNRAQEIYAHWGYKYLREGVNPIEVVFVKKLVIDYV